MNGLLLIDKPENVSSNGATSRMKYCNFGFDKIGHGGTLDPTATGLLIVLLGRAVKLSDFIIGHDKTYRVSACLGISKNTFDTEGETDGRCDKQISRDEMLQALADFPKIYHQTPPIYSAIKVKGKTAYRLVREGKAPEIPSREVAIKKLELLNFDFPRFQILTEVSSGTYVRSLIVDLAARLGTLAYVESLRRLSSGRFSVEEAAPLDEVLHWSPEEFTQHILPMELAVEGLPIIELSPEQAGTWVDGRWLPMRKIVREINPSLDIKPLKSSSEHKIILRVHSDGKLIGLGFFHRGFLVPEKVLIR
jgi:tRNA pseudouridine55 synthase